jgi:hypothetical protein
MKEAHSELYSVKIGITLYKRQKSNKNKQSAKKIKSHRKMACTEIIDDIEDLISSQDITPKERYANKKDVTLRNRKKSKKEVDEVEEESKPLIYDSVIPGKQKIYLKTWGCSHNASDSEYMAGQLAQYGELDFFVNPNLGSLRNFFRSPYF